MSIKKPATITDYLKWLKAELDVELTSRTKRYYETVTLKAANDFESSDIWTSLKSALNRLDQQYYLKTGYYLFVGEKAPLLVTKPYDSMVEKSFRKNVRNNSDWPEPPCDGWVLPTNWLSRVNDVVRTCFVVKYLDGVNFLVKEIDSFANELNYSVRVDFEAKEEGYYAAHYYIKFTCEVPREDWDTYEEVISIELQITTQLQEVIRKLLHKYYEGQRISSPNGNDVKWQWDYRSDEFAANYLGHILHYLEGMIMDVRDHRIVKELKDER